VRARSRHATLGFTAPTGHGIETTQGWAVQTTGRPRHRVVMGDGVVPEQRDGVSHTVVVRTPADAEQAVLAAVRGESVAAYVDAPGALADALVSDLRRLGTVEVRQGEDQRGRDLQPTTTPSLDPQARALLDLMVDGATLGEAAATLHLSRRTADRRVAEARRALGVPTTTAALVMLRVHRDAAQSADVR